MTRRAQWMWLVLVALIPAQLIAEEQIPWQTDLAKAMKQARDEKKLVLVHFYGDNCAPCRVVEQKVFPQPEVVQAITRNYVPVKINVDQAEKLATHYNVRSWPTDVFLTPVGQEVFRDTTRQSAADYVTILDQLAIQVGVGGARQAAFKEREARNDQQYQTGFVPPAQERSVQNQFATQNRYAEEGAVPQAQNQGYDYPQPEAQPSIYGAPSAGQQALPQNGPYGSQFQQPAGKAGGAYAQQPVTQRATWQDAGDITAPAQSIQNKYVLVKDAPPVALDGYCPVSICPPGPGKEGQWKRGDSRFGAVHRGRTYLFASANEQAKFLADPDAYSPVLSGADPVIFAERGELVDGRRSLGVALPAGRGRSETYLFATPESRDRFEKNPKQYAVTAHQAMLRSETKLR